MFPFEIVRECIKKIQKFLKERDLIRQKVYMFKVLGKRSSFK